MKLSKLSLISAIATLISRALGATNQIFSGQSQANANNINDGVSTAADTYNMYSGDGAECSGWPSMEKWTSFEDLWQANLPLMSKSCSNIYGPDMSDNSAAELESVRSAIQTYATTSNVDQRFILAIVMQESKGCVRVKTTTSPDGTVRNPGLMQAHDGDNTCNLIDDPVGVIRMQTHGMKLLANRTAALDILIPCPDSMIRGMVQDGVSGTLAGDGLAGVLNSALAYPAGPCSSGASSSALPTSPLAPRQAISGPNMGKWCKSGSASSASGTPLSSQPPPTRPSTEPPWTITPQPNALSSITSVSTTYITLTIITTLFTPSSPPSAPSNQTLLASPPPTSAAANSTQPAPPPPPPPSTSRTSAQVNAQTYYQAARLWNSGQLDLTDLGNGFVSTNCFASDIANRLTGWTGKDADASCTRCTLDIKPGAACPWGVCLELCPSG